MFTALKKRWLWAGLALSLPATGWAAGECSVSATSLNFGNYNPLDLLPRDSSAAVNVSCNLLLGLSLAVSYELRLSTGSGGGYGLRTLVGPGTPLGYQLYLDPARLLVWGDGTAGTATVTDSFLLGLLGVNRQYPVYGRLPAGQQVAGGLYADSITVTLDF